MSIVDAIQNQLSGEALAGLGAAVGVSEDAARQAIGAAVPAVLSSLSNATLDGDRLNKLMDALRDFEGTAPAEDIGGAKADVLGAILGPNLPTLIELLARFTGLSASAIGGLLERLGPVILAAIAARLRGTGGLTPANLTSFFTAEKGEFTKSLPGGLSLADLPSLPGVPTAAPAPRPAPSEPPSWLAPVLIAGLLALAAFYYIKLPPERPAPPPKPADASEHDDAPIPPAPTGEAPVATPARIAD